MNKARRSTHTSPIKKDAGSSAIRNEKRNENNIDEETEVKLSVSTTLPTTDNRQYPKWSIKKLPDKWAWHVCSTPGPYTKIYVLEMSDKIFSCYLQELL